MEEITKCGKATCRFSVAAALTLMVGGILLCGYLLGMLPAQWELEVWKFLLCEVAALLPVVAGGVWITRLYRRGRRRGWRSGTVGTVIFGVILVVAGMLLFIFSSGIVLPEWRRVLISWQMLLVVVGIIRLCKSDTASGIIFLAAGTFFLIPRIETVFPEALAVPSEFASAYWPILLVVAGLSVIIGIGVGRRTGKQKSLSGQTVPGNHGSQRCPRPYDASHISQDDGTIYHSYIFSGAEQVFLEPVFRGGSIRAVFGGMELDLRRTTLPEGTTYLRVEAVFGGVEIKAPGDWNILLESHSVFGGVEDERYSYKSSEQDGRQLVIIANCAFGGCSVE